MIVRVAQHSSNLRAAVRSAAHIGCSVRNHRIEADDLHAERARESSRELADLPRSRSRPASCAPARARSDSAGRGHLPAATASVLDAPRNRISAAAITYSATASALAPVAGMTSMPRDLQLKHVDVVRSPTPSRPTTSIAAPRAKLAVDLSLVCALI